MRRALAMVAIFINCIFSFSNCQVSRHPNADSEKPSDRSSAEKKMQRVSGLVTITSSYCGGAAPSEEMLMELAKPKPYVGKVFYVRKGNRNTLASEIILRFTTDSNGAFSIALPAGTWSLIQEEQVREIKNSDYPNTASHQVEMDCLRKWWSEPYQVIEVKNSAITDLHFSFHRRCFIASDIPCIRYTGPMPP